MAGISFKSYDIYVVRIGMFFDNILRETGSSSHLLSRLTEHHFVVMHIITRANWLVSRIYIYLLL
jgi:hypothetical protein